LEYLSEDSIKRATLAFMKTYYKFRPRNGETIIRYDMMHTSGVIVDGHLTFPKEDGTPFVATFEATSASSSAEVLYRLQSKQLQWDAVAGGAIFTFIALFCFWAIDFWSIYNAGWIFSILLVAILFVLSFLAYQMFNRSAGRYRYIYAIEQFKQYHADEQWVALGSDVFSDPLDSNFSELKLQCVKNGFGLLTVDSNEQVNLLITPARDEVFGKKRLALKFEETAVVNSGLQRLNPQSLERFARPFLKQIAISATALLLLSGLFYRSWQTRPVNEVSSAAAYRDSMKLRSPFMEANKEPQDLVFNADDLVKTDPNPKAYDATQVSNPPVDNNNVGLYVFSVLDGYISYDCERLDMHGTKFVVQDLTFNNFADAKRRIENLKTYGMIANAISLDCTLNGTPKHGYCVYYEVIFNEEKVANTKALEVKKQLEKLNLNHDFIKLRILNFQNF
jgi:hypothetical protein